MGTVTKKGVEFFLSENFNMDTAHLLKDKQPNEKFKPEHKRILENLFTSLTGLRVKDETISVVDWMGDPHYWKYKSFKHINCLNDMVKEMNYLIDEKRKLSILTRVSELQEPKSENQEQDFEL